MGFWGTFVVHRGDRALGELLPHVAEFGEAELCAGGAPGGWQVTRVFCSLNELTEGFLTGLRDLTAAPVLAADVLDSDAAFVTALGVQTGPWQTWLNLDAAMGYLVTPPAPFDEDDNYLGDDWVDPEYERGIAALKGRKGSFVLQHFGLMARGEGTLTVSVVPDSGTDELTGLTGTFVIVNDAGEHSYQFDYDLP